MKFRNQSTAGLSALEAEKRLMKYGPNKLRGRKKKPPAALFLSQFRDVFVMILLAATMASFFMGNIGEAVTIIIIVFLNALLGFIQEYRTEKTMEAMQKLSAPQAKVWRSGVLCVLPAEQLVPGDLIAVEAGDSIPADACLQQAASLSCNESMLTGESVPVFKEQGAEIYMGTTAVKGKGTALVTQTGMKTRMGSIAHMLDEIAPGPTPMQQRLDEMGKWIGLGCLLICAGVSLIGFLRGEALFDMVMLGISLAVAAIPEGLCAIVTVSLALSVRRILKHNALVRQLHTVETLGCADVICTDKTGTLTENRMTVTEYFTFAQGRGVAERRQSGKSMERMLEIALFCSSIPLDKAAKTKSSFQDPTETALAVAAEGIWPHRKLPSLTRCAEEPFDSARKMMSVTVKTAQGESLLFTKGAPDVLLTHATHYMLEGTTIMLDHGARQAYRQAYEEMAGRGLRVIGFAWRPAAGDKDLREENLILTGLMAMKDPPRKEAAPAVAACRHAGIRPVMITGDSPHTAVAVAKELKIFTPGDTVLTGSSLDTLTEEQLSLQAEKTSVFCRVTPEHKLKIVQALKSKGHVVAMTGDGVNDAPAVREADIGVAMGQNGTDICREASSMVLLDNNFATIVAAVEEGRIIYANIRKFLRYLLSCNIGEVVTMFAGMLMGLPVVLLPIQILLVNLVTDGLPAMALGSDPAESSVMNRLPRGREESVFSGGLMGKILFRGCLIGLSSLFTFTAVYGHTANLAAARTATLITLVCAQLFHAFECRSESKTLFEKKERSNPALMLSVLFSFAVCMAVVYFPPAARLFETMPLSPGQMIFSCGVSLAAPLCSTAVSLLGRILHAGRPSHFTTEDKNDIMSE